MGLDFIVNQSELDREEYNVSKKLTGFSLRLDEQIDRYSNKADGQLVFELVKEFRKVETAVYEKAKTSLPSGAALALGTQAAASLAKEKLDYRGRDGVDFFSDKAISYKGFPETADQIVQIYVQALTEPKQRKSLECVTNSFFQWLVDDSANYLHKNSPSTGLDGMKISVVGRKHQPVSYLGKSETESSQQGSIDVNLYVQAPPLVSAPTLAEAYIYGHENVKSEFKNIATVASNMEFFLSLFSPKDLFKSYLLVGPPGTGKTTLVNTLASQIGFYFLKVPCVEIGSKFHSESASNLHEIYKSAKRILSRGNTPGVVVFFDEIDQIAKRRGSTNSSESDSLVTTLNENLDGGSTHPGIITIGATNLEEEVDPALIGRFEVLYVGYPSSDEELVGIHKTIIRKKEATAKRKMFEEIDYFSVLPFSRRDERYKSGREINKILHRACFRKACLGVSKNEYRPVTTEEVVREYEGHSFEQKRREISLGLNTIVR